MTDDDYERLKIIARGRRANPSTAEASLWRSLTNNSMDGHQFWRQHVIGGHILDFYCPALRLAIEIKEVGFLRAGMDVDEDLDSRLGIRVLRFTDERVLEEKSEVLDIIRTTCRSRDRKAA